MDDFVNNAIVVGVLLTLAAGLGATLRYLVDGYIDNEFPYGTLAVNLVASFVLGVVAAADEPLPAIIGIGALGALSTWSAVANEAATMARSNQGSLALGYLGLSVATGVLLAWFGLRIGAVVF